MKKILFLLFATLLFVSCSQDESLTETSDKDGKDSTAVTFKIGTPFSVEIGNLRSTSLEDGEALYFRYIVYDQNGKFFKDKLGDFTFNRKEGFEINDILVSGTYYIVIMASDDRYEINKFVPDNYSNDIYRKTSDNGKLYFEAFEYVTKDDYKTVLLSPMFVEINVNLGGWQDGVAETLGVSHITFDLVNIGDAFKISTKETVSTTSRNVGFEASQTSFHLTTSCFAANEETHLMVQIHKKNNLGEPVRMESIFKAERGQRVSVNGDLLGYQLFKVQIDDELEDVSYPITPVY